MFIPLRRTLHVSFASFYAIAIVSPALASAHIEEGDQMSAAVLTDWVAVVKDGQDAATCAADVEASGEGRIRDVLDAVGILLVTTFSADGRGLEAVPCVEAIEIEAAAGISGIAGATN